MYNYLIEYFNQSFPISTSRIVHFKHIWTLFLPFQRLRRPAEHCLARQIKTTAAESIKQCSSRRNDNIPEFMTPSQLQLKGKQYKTSRLERYEHAHRGLSSTKTMRAVHELWDASLCRGQNKTKAWTATVASAPQTIQLQVRDIYLQESC